MTDTQHQADALRAIAASIRQYEQNEIGAAELALSVSSALDYAALTPPEPITAQAQGPDHCVARITLPQAQALLDYFGGDNTEVLLYDLPEGRITDDDGKPSPAGLYAVCAECPEEGATYLGDHAAAAPQTGARTTGGEGNG